MTRSLSAVSYMGWVFFVVVLGFSLDSACAEVPSNGGNGTSDPNVGGMCNQGSSANEIVSCTTRTRTSVKVSTPIIIGIVAAGIVVLVLIAAFIIWRRRVRALHSASDSSRFDFASTSASSKVPTTHDDQHRSESPRTFSMRYVITQPSGIISHVPSSDFRWDDDSTERGRDIEAGLKGRHLSAGLAEEKGLDVSAQEHRMSSSKKCEQEVEVYVLPATPDPIRSYSDVERELGRGRTFPLEW